MVDIKRMLFNYNIKFEFPKYKIKPEGKTNKEWDKTKEVIIILCQKLDKTMFDISKNKIKVNSTKDDSYEKHNWRRAREDMVVESE